MGPQAGLARPGPLGHRGHRPVRLRRRDGRQERRRPRECARRQDVRQHVSPLRRRRRREGPDRVRPRQGSEHRRRARQGRGLGHAQGPGRLRRHSATTRGPRGRRQGPEGSRDLRKTTPIVNEKLVVNSGNKGVKNVFVYLQRPTAVNEEAKKAALAEKGEFDQKNCTYIPHALGVIAGETVVLKSSDPTNHNVNFQLKNLSLNPLIAPGKTMDVTPDSPERAAGARELLDPPLDEGLLAGAGSSLFRGHGREW